MEKTDIDAMGLPQWLAERYRRFLDNGDGPAWVAFDEKGTIAVFGAAKMWDGLFELWFRLIRKENTVTLVRLMKRILANSVKPFGAKRVFATVDCRLEAGQRLLEVLGFRCETPFGMKGYNPDGSNAYLYARVF